MTKPNPLPQAPAIDSGSLEQRNRRLYLDVMERCLLNTIYEDAGQEPSARGSFDAAKRDQGLDWPSVAHTMIGHQRLRNLRQCCEQVLEAGIPGDFVETGIWRGGACILMRAVLASFGDDTRSVWCADSFEGLPKPDATNYPADAGDTHHVHDPLRISLEQVQDNFRKYGLLDGQVKFLKGWFKDTLPTAPIDRIAVLRLDGDMYQSTMDALEALYDKVVTGGFVIVDDFGAVPACAQAVRDYLGARKEVVDAHEIDWTGVYWRKP